MTPPNLTDVLAAHRAGGAGASWALVEYISDRIETLATRLLSQYPLAARWDRPSDVAQDVRLRLYAALEKVRPDDDRHLLALASKKVREELIDRVRRHNAQKRGLGNQQTLGAMPVDQHPVYAAPADLSGPATNEKWSCFWAAIEDLSPEQREIFDAKWLLEVETAAIAQMLGCSESTVGRRWREIVTLIKTRCGDGA